MENKVNIAEILKDCPPGMKLYSPIFGNVYLDKIRPHLAIVVTTDKEQGNIKEEFLYDGRYGMNGECMLFPSKDKTTWEGFEPPCEFKDGDIVYFMCNCGDEYTAIFKKMGNKYLYTYIDFNCGSFTGISESLFEIEYIKEVRLATEEEKRNFFDVIKENGYHWNAETKTLEELVEPKFKVGDRIRCKNGVDKYGGLEEGIIDTITDNKYGIVIPHLMGIVALINITDQDNWELVALKFKTGDRIRRKIKRRNYIDEGEIKSVSFNFYDVFTTDEKSISIPIREQDEWELVPDKIKPKFKVGDVVQDKDGYKVEITEVNNDDEYYVCISNIASGIESVSFKYQIDYKLVSDEIEPKFKVGD